MPKLPQAGASRRLAIARRWTNNAAWLTIALGGLTLLGHFAEAVPVPRSGGALFPDPGSGILLIVAGLTLRLFNAEYFGTVWQRVGRFGALFLTLAAIYLLAAQLAAPTAWPLGNVLLMPWSVPSANTALDFSLAGLALLLLPSRTHGRITPAQIFALLLLANGLITTAGYLYRADVLYRFPSPNPHLGTSPLLTLGFVLLGTGILTARPERGFTGFLLAPSVGSRSARRLLPLAVLLPLVLGGVVLAGMREGYFGPAYGFAVFSIAAALLSGVLLALALWPGYRTESHLRKLERQLRSLIESVPDAVIVADDTGNIRLFNRAAEEMFGYSRDEVMGRPIDALIAHHQQGTFREYMAFQDDDDGEAESLIDRRGIETCGKHKTGAEYPLEIRRRALGQESGWTVAVARDQSERARAEQLRDQLSAIVNTAEQAIITVNLEGVITAWNPGAECLYGYPADEMIGQPLMRIYPEEKHAEVKALLDHARTGKHIPDREAVQLKSTGETIEVYMALAPIHDPGGRVAGIVGINHDITAQKRNEAALRKSEAAMAEAQRIAHLGNWEWQVESDAGQWSPEFERILGTHFTGGLANFLTLVVPEDRQRVERAVDEAIQHQKSFSIDYRIRRPADGAERIVHAEGEPSRAPDGGLKVAGTLQDVTEEKLARERLEESERKYRQIVETAEEGIWVINAEARTTFVNARMAEMLGYEREEMLGRPLLDFMDAQDQPLVEERLAKQQHEKALHWEKAFLRKDGGRRWTRGTANSMFDSEGRYTGALAMVIDITQEQRAQAEREALLQSVEADRAWLNAVIRRSPVGIVLLDMGTQPSKFQIRLNPSAAELFGAPYSSEWEPFKPEDFLDSIRLPWGQHIGSSAWLMERLKNGEEIPARELIIKRPDGKQFAVMGAMAPIRASTGKGAVIGATAILTDITPLKELERKREEWTAVVAHDLRQPVSAILLRADILAAKCEKISPELCGQVKHIHTASERLNRQIGDLLDVSRIESNRLELHRVMLPTAPFLREVLEREARVTEGHAVRLHCPDNIAAMYADPGRIEQVLTNLLSNAAKYGTPGSPIDIDVTRFDARLRISVINRGPGLRIEDGNQLFERFHRAEKGSSEITGVGLGLYIVRGLVEAHGGQVSVESTPGKTTTFAFTVPVAQEAAARTVRASEIEGREFRVEDREGRAQGRESKVKTRESAMETRESKAESQKQVAEGREAKANRREARADDREAKADTREAKANSREAKADSRVASADRDSRRPQSENRPQTNAPAKPN